MIKLNKLTKKTAFTVDQPHAQSVSLAGDFNQWNTQSHPMKTDKKGMWKIEIALEPGTYQFRYFVDQSWWMNDPVAGEIGNEHGSTNSVAVVEEIKKTGRKPAVKKTVKATVKKTAKKSPGRPKKK